MMASAKAGARILLVEDEALIAMELEERLAKFGFKCIGVAASGDEARALAESLLPDLIIMDVRIEGTDDGIVVAGDIRSRLDIPIIFLTAYGDSATIQRAKATGPLGYLLKPFSDQELQAAVEIALFKHATDLQLELYRNHLEELVLERTTALEVANNRLKDEIAERRRAEQSLIRSNRLLEAVREAQGAFIVESESQQSSQILLDALLRFTGSEYGFLGEVILEENGSPYVRTQAIAEASGDERVQAFMRQKGGRPREFRKLDALYGGVMARGELVITNEPAKDGRSAGVPDGHPTLNAFMGIPVRAGGAVVGMVALANRPGGYEESLDRQFEPLIATYGAMIVARRNFDRRQQAEAQLRTVNANLEALVDERTVELEQSKKRFEDLFEWSPDAILMVGPDGRIVMANRQAETLFRYDRGELVGQTVEALMPTMSRAAHVGLRERYMCAPTHRNMTERPRGLFALRKDGGAFPAEISLGPIDPADSTLIAATVRDVSERLQADESIREALATLDATEDAAFIWDPATREITYANQGAARLLGRRRDQVVGMTLFQALPEIGESLYRDDVQPLAGNGSKALTISARHRHTNGVEFPVEMKIQHVPKSEGRSSFIALVRDVTEQQHVVSELESTAAELKRAKDAVEEERSKLAQRVAERTDELLAMNEALMEAKKEADAASKAKDSFLAMMSHEIRTPMNALSGILELLSLNTRDSEQWRMLSIASESADTLLRIVNDLLEFSKIEAGRMDIRAYPALVSSCLDSVQRMFSDSARRKGLTLDCVVDPEVPEAVEWDALRVKQILSNLVSNALKFTERGGIRIHVSAGADQLGTVALRIEVSDTGIGVSDEDQKKLFEPFVQAGTDRTRRFGGSGLGLAICRGLAELMGGTVQLRSRPGEGTRVTLRIPARVVDDPGLVESDDTGAHGVIPQLNGLPTRAERILVCDDNALNRHVVAYQLSALGYRVETAEEGNDALQRWRGGDFSLLLLDCQMPGLSGYEVARRIREEEQKSTGRRRRTVILAYTADVIEEDRQRCFECGMDDIITKPARLNKLRSKLDFWLQGGGDSRPPGMAAESDASDSAAHEGPVNWELLEELVGTDEEFQKEILREFVEDKGGEASLLASSAAEGGFDELARRAHRLRGAALVIAAQRLAEQCALMEQAARRKDRSTLVRLAVVLEAEFVRVATLVRDDLGKAPVDG